MWEHRIADEETLAQRRRVGQYVSMRNLNAVPSGAEDWMRPLEGDRVARIDLEDGFFIHLDSGAEIRITALLGLNRGSEISLTESASTAYSAMALLARRVVRNAVVTNQGTLQITFDDGLTLTVIATTERDWRVRFTDGRTFCSLKGGGSEMIP